MAVVNFSEIFLKSERVTGVVAGGGLSYNDCREIFRHQVEKVERLGERFTEEFTQLDISRGSELSQRLMAFPGIPL